MRVFLAAISLCAPLLGAQDTQQRLKDASAVLHEIMATPDKGIPADLIQRASCVVIVPGLKKAALGIGGQYGRGFVTCRKEGGTGWSAPAAMRVEGGSFGFQIGGSETDVVMLVMNQDGMNKLERSKITLGADASIAAGPVGRTAAANTDAYMNAELLSWSRSRGVFAGIALNGATLRPDKDANAELYGKPIETREVLAGNYPMPAAASSLIAELDRYAGSGANAPANAEREDTSGTTRRRRDRDDNTEHSTNPPDRDH